MERKLLTKPMQNPKQTSLYEWETSIFDKILQEDDSSGGACASDFSGFVPEKPAKIENKENEDI